jgi:hypothetical protein
MTLRTRCLGPLLCLMLAIPVIADDKPAGGETPQETPKEAPKETPKKTAKDAPKEAPKESPKEAPKKTPKKAPKRAPKKAPTKTPFWGRGPKRIYPPKIDAEAAGKKAIEMFDADKDGKISGEELWKCPGLKAAMSMVDPQGTGEVTAEMITARIKAWQASRLGRMSLRCMVTHRGEPLAGAEVKFVPEKFLGKNMKTAGGVTDPNGVAMLSIPLDDGGPPGVPPGFYRVEINKQGTKISAKYNKDTIFGQEVAIDSPTIRTGILFDLDF